MCVTHPHTSSYAGTHFSALLLLSYLSFQPLWPQFHPFTLSCDLESKRWLFNSCIFHWDKKGSRVFCRTEDHAGEQVQGPQVPSSSPWGDSIYQLICNSNSVWTWHHYFGLSGILWATYGEEPRGASISMWNQKDTWNLFFVVSAEILRYGFQLLRSTKHAYKYCSKVMKNVQL